MFCSTCGQEIDDDAVFCKYCGALTADKGVSSEYYAPPFETNTSSGGGWTNGCAIAGFVLAFFLPLIGFIVSIAGIVKAKKHGKSGKGLAVAGLVISLLNMLVFFAAIAFLFIIMA